MSTANGNERMGKAVVAMLGAAVVCSLGVADGEVWGVSGKH